MEGLRPLDPFGECYKAFFPRPNSNSRDDLTNTVFECKRLAQSIKQQRPSRKCLPADIHRFFPDRVIMDELVRLYFATFESCYGILWYSSFLRDYDAGLERPENAESPLLLQILLVMTVAGPLHSDASVRAEMAANARIWIHIAQNWLSAPMEKDRLTLKAIQVYCLVLLSREVNHVGADLVWISVGSLVRIAMQMGLHQDPDLLGQMDIEEKELRRRLWYTILEMNAHSAIDSGMSPMITDDDYNTRPPSTRDQTTEVDGQDASALTKCSFQPLLAKSIPLRLRITRIINSMQEEPSYDKVLELGNELAAASSEAAKAISESPSTNTFGSSFCTHILRRFSLCLHYRPAVKAKTNPLYSHSRNVCLEAALDVVALLDDNLYSRILCIGGGMFRDLITRGALLIFLELSPDLSEDTSIFAKRRRRARQELLLNDARRVVRYSKDRMSHCDTNVKTYVCLCMMLAQAEARLEGLPLKEAVENATRDSLSICRDILQATESACATDTRHPDLEAWTNGVISPPHLDTNLDEDLDRLFNFDFTSEQFSMQWPVETSF
jgi:hypothetical protein